MNPRAAAKGLLESLLVWLGPAALARRAFRRRGLVLAYHNIVPAGERPASDRSLHLPEAAFRTQLDLLEQHARIVPLGKLLLPDDSDSSRPRIAITFDDAYRGAVSVGLAELARRGHPATMFVTPGCLGGEGFWWDRITAPDGGALPEDFRAAALDMACGRTESVLELARRRGLPLVEVPTHARPATEQELRGAVSAPVLSLGAHTWSHPNLSRLEGGELLNELDSPLAWLRGRFPRVEPWLAYPYGLTAPHVEAAAAASGYAASFLVQGGWLPTTPPRPHRYPRLNVPAGLSPQGFTLRTAGLLAA